MTSWCRRNSLFFDQVLQCIRARDFPATRQKRTLRSSDGRPQCQRWPGCPRRIPSGSSRCSLSHASIYPWIDWKHTFWEFESIILINRQDTVMNLSYSSIRHNVIDWLVDWWIPRSIDWLIDWLIDWSITRRLTLKSFGNQRQSPLHSRSHPHTRRRQS